MDGGETDHLRGLVRAHEAGPAWCTRVPAAARSAQCTHVPAAAGDTGAATAPGQAGEGGNWQDLPGVCTYMCRYPHTCACTHEYAPAVPYGTCILSCRGGARQALGAACVCTSVVAPVPTDPHGQRRAHLCVCAPCVCRVPLETCSAWGRGAAASPRRAAGLGSPRRGDP